MARINRPATSTPKFTHEGAPAVGYLKPIMQLRRSVLACLLWEDQFYEDGQSIADRIATEARAVKPEELAQLALDARTQFNLRHVPLLLLCTLVETHKGKLVGDTIAATIQRPDELTELLSLWWKDGKRPLPRQLKLGLGRAFRKFDEYALAKYNRKDAVQLRDVLFLTHAKPRDDEQARLWAKLANKTFYPEALREQLGLGEYEPLASPETWENRLSRGEDKKATFESMMLEGKLGGLAFLRNLRNMRQAGISKTQVAAYGAQAKLDRVLPFRFIAAARAVPEWEDIIEPMMFRASEKLMKLPGKTTIVVDNSGSMHMTKVSAKSDMNRFDAAAALAVLLREVCEDVTVIGFGNNAAVIPPRRGFALRDAIRQGPGGGTDTAEALRLAFAQKADRYVVFTDEQSHTRISAPPKGSRGYFINVASYKNGIGYGPWVHMDGFSEAVFQFMQEYEAAF